ncbi:hypothetical protein CCAX7_36270 [Capsulimonas corticalis]|uniref:Uncharacterized protein n=1 Tax=Capsulimonas corticalis TaxID=2219043 RepID=A0A402D6X2_9BACT|nr:hypothetical protein CCAX7_36270 [Capsulimonas corticalis]
MIAIEKGEKIVSAPLAVAIAHTLGISADELMRYEPTLHHIAEPAHLNPGGHGMARREVEK